MVGICYLILCVSVCFFIVKGLFWYIVFDGNGCNMVGFFVEDFVKCLQNGLNFSGIGGCIDNLVYNQYYLEN